ncbi:MAG: AraC family transcriptional regulator [Acidobacteriota bacterium]
MEARQETGPNSVRRQEYLSRINRVVDHIEAHLDKRLSLQSLASVANFSVFHFHRIFRAIVGETLNQFVQRVRVEKAASRLIHNPRISITQIALGCGFSGSAAFARAFREAFGMSPSQWRNKGRAEQSKIRETKSNGDQTNRKDWKDAARLAFYIDGVTNAPIWRIEMKGPNQVQADVAVKDVPEMHVAYVRHIGPYKGNAALFEGLFQELMKWAGPRGLLRFPQTQLLSVYHDDPTVTEEDKLRVSVCITIPKETPAEGEVGRMTIPGGRYAMARFEIGADEYQQAWDAVFGGWLPESGYQPDDRPCYELYHNDPKTHPQGKHIVDICVPVRPL